MSQPKHKDARHHFARLLKDMADRGAFPEEMRKRLEDFKDGPHFYVLDGKTPRRVRDVLAWARAFGSKERHLAADHVGRVAVSTVFLGIDHNYFGGEPLIFETMVFGGKHDGAQSRYSTYDEALRGHQWWLAKVTKSEGN